MAFSTSSFFAGVGTVFAAVTIGFAGGTLIATSPKVEPPNRLERVAGNMPLQQAPVAKAETPSTAKPETPPVPPAQIARAETTETPPAPDRATATPAASGSQDAVAAPTPPVTTPVIARDDAAAKADSVKKVGDSEPQIESTRNASERQVDDARKARESQFRKDRAEQRAARYERRKRQEIEAAANAVRQMQRDGVLQETAQREDIPRDAAPRPGLNLFGNERDDAPRESAPRLGFFGND